MNISKQLRTALNDIFDAEDNHEIARHINICSQNVAKLRTGSMKMSLNNAERIAKAFGKRITISVNLLDK